MAIIRSNKQSPAKRKRLHQFPDISSDSWCAKRRGNPKNLGVRVMRHRIIGIRVRKNDSDKYAYLYQEDRELDNAIRTMKKILGEIE